MLATGASLLFLLPYIVLYHVLTFKLVIAYVVYSQALQQKS
jgi:hypothetical protein